MIARHGAGVVAIGVAAALAAALCWTLASGLWRRLPTSLGALQLNLLKNLLALGMLAGPASLAMGRPAPAAMALLAASGVLGIAAGDSLFFAALRRLGTRRTLTLEAGGPAVASAAGSLWLGEVPGPGPWGGIALISLALVLVARQRAPDPADAGPQRLGLLLALAALACGSGGALLARAALQDGAISALQAATIRLAAACLTLSPLLPGLLPGLRRWRSGPRPAQRRWPRVLVATLLGTSAGIVLQQLALSRLPAGLAVGLLATSPVMAAVLAPLEGERVSWVGWVAACAALAGVTLLVR
jgi:drug/metabolite transporter (DMT)-like permease